MRHKNFSELYPYGYLLIRKSDGKKYVGMRYANVKYNLTPEEDFGRVYFTSGRFKKDFKKNPENYHFILKWTFDSVEELFEWERKVALIVYKRKDWANQGWGQNYGDNPEIGSLISEGKNRIKSDGKSSVQQGAEKLKEWIWNTEEGSNWRKAISDRKILEISQYSEERVAEIQRKRKASMNFKAAADKGMENMRLDIDESGLNMLQRKARKAAETRKLKGTESEAGKLRDAKYTQKLGEMSEEEFAQWCEGRHPRTTNAAKSRRNKYLKQIENN